MPPLFIKRCLFIAPAVGILLAVLLTACGTTPDWAKQTPITLHHPGKILYVAYPADSVNTQIFAINPDGTDPVQLTDLPKSASSPAWSPDGTQIVFVYGGYDSQRTQDITEVYVMAADGTKITPLTRFDDQAVSSPVWSPDGTRIAFQVNPQMFKSHIYVMNADGGDLRRLSPEDADDKHPSWSADGQYLIYANVGGNSIDDLYVMNANGSGRASLFTNTTLDSNPVWSPDGKRIVWISHRDGYFGDLYVMNADGSGVRRLTFTEGDDEGSPTWSPDGTQIAYHAHTGGVGTDIRIIDANGGSARVLVADAFSPAW